MYILPQCFILLSLSLLAHNTALLRALNVLLCLILHFFFFAKTAYKYGLFLILEFQGFRYVASGPMVRSSYKAGEFYIKAMIEADRVKTSTVDLSS
jgi:hypothetical protein